MTKIMKYITNPSKMLGLMGSMAIVMFAWTIYNRYSNSKSIAAAAAADAGSAYRNVKAAFTKEEADNIKSDVSSSLKADFAAASQAGQTRLIEAFNKKIAEVKMSYTSEIETVKSATVDMQKSLNESLEATKKELADLKATKPQDSFTEAAKNKLNNTYKQAEELANRHHLQFYFNVVTWITIGGVLFNLYNQK